MSPGAAGTPELEQMLPHGLAAQNYVARRSGAEGFAALSLTRAPQIFDPGRTDPVGG